MGKACGTYVYNMCTFVEMFVHENKKNILFSLSLSHRFQSRSAQDLQDNNIEMSSLNICQSLSTDLGIVQSQFGGKDGVLVHTSIFSRYVPSATQVHSPSNAPVFSYKQKISTLSFVRKNLHIHLSYVASVLLPLQTKCRLYPKCLCT